MDFYTSSVNTMEITATEGRIDFVLVGSDGWIVHQDYLDTEEIMGLLQRSGLLDELRKIL